jgi:serine/threonine protein kinase
LSSLIGRKLGQYEVVGLLGRGGMATVYKGYQASLDREVAIKVLPPHPGMDDQFIERFRLEARTIGNLQNPNILPLYDYGTEENILYLVMAYVSGGSLADYLDGKLDPKRVEKWLREIASGLDFAHRKGVVHRDIKPGNILIDSDGHALLADFGVVKMLASGANLTGTSIVGTPAYMSPEQGQGIDVDGRSDVYSLGVMAYEMLTGQHPYRADTPMQTILKHITDPIPDILQANPDLPTGLGVVIEKVLAKTPQDRYQTAVEFAEDFSKALHGDQSLIAIRKVTPLDGSADGATLRFDMPPAPMKPADSKTPAPAQPTIIMRETTNPLIFLGAFGLIALVIVVVAGLILNQQNQRNSDVVVTSSVVVSNPTVASATSLPSVPNFGQVKYNTTTNFGDTVTVTLQGIKSPSSGNIYVAWLTNTLTNETITLGALPVLALGEASVTYNAPTDAPPLPLSFNAFWITEQSAISDTPNGNVVYSGRVPTEMMSTLTEILVTSSIGFNGVGLVESAKIEAKFGEQHAGLAARATNVGGQRQHAEHTINILQGTQEDFTGDGSGQNPGRKKGVYVFLDRIDELVTATINAEGATATLQANGELIRICTQNVRTWADRVIVLEKEIIASETVEAVAPQAQESTELAGFITTGVDANQNGIIEPFEGECGLEQIIAFGVQFANISVFEGGLNAD